MQKLFSLLHYLFNNFTWIDIDCLGVNFILFNVVWFFLFVSSCNVALIGRGDLDGARDT